MAWLEGYPREKIEWFPTIDESKCVKCGMCMNCSKDVYEWRKDIEIARGIYKKEGIWGKVKDVLKKNGKIK